MTTHYISRRRLLSVAAGGTALVLAGCGSAGLSISGTTDESDTSTAPAPNVAAQGETVLRADVDGTLFELDPAGHLVTRLDAAGNPAWTSPPGELNFPRSVAVDSHGTVCVANHGDCEIVMFDGAGTPTGSIGGPGDEPGEFNFLPDLAFDSTDHLFAVDKLNHRVQVLDSAGTVVRTFGELGSGPGQLNGPTALALDSEEHIHVLDAGNWRIQVFDPHGRPLYEYGGYGSGAGEFLLPYDLAIDAWDRVYVADPATRRVLVFEDAGYRVAEALEPVNKQGEPVTPLRVDVDPEGGLLLNVSPIEAPAAL